MGSDFNQKPDIPRPLFFSEHDLIATIMLFMMLGLNLGVKLFFRQRDNQRRLVQLEKENLTQQLEYLKYQINPHFLMNTLNNIHALVDIDQEKAKKSIVELSKIMRYVLYDGARETVQLRRETEFVENYIHLMRLRYSSRVDISVDIPRELPDSQVPEVQAFIDRFLLGRSADTSDVRIVKTDKFKH
jgi:LytS/YehU family sensor histidine kinase